VVNLSAFETFFEEKRAFFLEGAQIFNNFGRGGSNGNWGFNNSEPQIFYSRRIGRSPQLQPDAEFADPPTATTILGAAKLTGKTARGWSIGLLEAITSTEKAPTQTAFVRGEAVVEPMTNYGVVRLQRDIGRRAGVGMLATTVNRRITTPAVNATLPDNAYVAGADGYLFLDADRDWAMNLLRLAVEWTDPQPPSPGCSTPANAITSGPTHRICTLIRTRRVSAGSPAASVSTATADSSRSNALLWGVSPGFESNDLGFIPNGDRAGTHAVVMWRNVTPGRVLRDRFIWVAKAYTWNFARELQSDGFGSQARVTFLNYWNAGAAFFANRHSPDDRLTRGGPMAMSPRGFDLNGWVNTDGRKPAVPQHQCRDQR
jgi:hypothetical protein